MIDKKLKDYIDSQIEKGVSVFDLRKVLDEEGWRKDDIDTAMQAATSINEGGEGEKNNRLGKIIKSKGLLLFLLLVVLIIAAGSLFGYFYIYLAPEKVMARSIVKMQQVETLKYSGTASIKIDNQTGQDQNKLGDYGSGLVLPTIPTEVIVDFSGGGDTASNSNSKSYVIFEVKVNQEFVAKAEARSLGKILYLNFHDLMDFEYFDLKSLTNKWIRFDLAELTKDYTGYQLGEGDELSLSEEEEVELWELIIENPPFTVSEKLESEKIDDRDMYHYKVKIEKRNLEIIIIRVLEMLAGETMEQAGKDDFHQVMANIDFADVEVWVGKKDLYVYKYKFSLTTKDTMDNLFIFNLEMKFNNHNQPVDVSVPSETSSIEEVFAEIFGDLTLPEEYQETEIESSDVLLPEDFGDYKMTPEDYENLLNISLGETAGFNAER